MICDIVINQLQSKWNRPQFEREIWPHWQWLSPLGSEKDQNLSSSTAFGPWVPPWDDNDGPPHHIVITLPSDHHKQQKGQKSVEFNSFGTLGSSSCYFGSLFENLSILGGLFRVLVIICKRIKICSVQQLLNVDIFIHFSNHWAPNSPYLSPWRKQIWSLNQSLEGVSGFQTLDSIHWKSYIKKNHTHMFYPLPGVGSEDHRHMLNCHLLEVDSIWVGIQELLGGHLACKLQVLEDTGQKLLKFFLPLDDELPIWVNLFTFKIHMSIVLIYIHQGFRPFSSLEG